MSGLASISKALDSVDTVTTKLAQTLAGPLQLQSNTVAGSYTVIMAPGHGIITGDEIAILTDSMLPDSFFAKVLNVSTNTLTLDTPIDIAFIAGVAIVFKVNTGMNVNGSVTPVVFNIANGSHCPIFLNRIILHVTDDAVMDDGKFGGLAALTRGVVLRKSKADGTYHTIFNIKKNGDLGLLAYDKSYDDKAPAGVYGLRVRLSFAGDDKHGTQIRLNYGDKLQILIQDNLTGLTSFHIMAEGKICQ